MINYMIDSENVGTTWIPYLKENIKKAIGYFYFIQIEVLLSHAMSLKS